MQASNQATGFNWQTVDKWCVTVAFLGLFCMVGSFYLAPGYGEVARTFYVLIMLPALIALPYWLPRANLASWPWLVFLLPIAYLAMSNFWIDEQHINHKRSLWYFIKPLLFLMLLLLAAQRVVQSYPQVCNYLVRFVTVVALISGILSLWQYWPTVAGKSHWPRMAGMSVNHDINVTASLYGINIIFCLYGLVKWSTFWRGLVIASMATSMLIVVLTQSKAPLVYFVVAIALIFFNGARGRGSLKPVLIICLLSVATAGAFYYFDRIPFLDRTISYSIRFELWKAVIEQSASHIWFGHGVGSDIKFQIAGKDYPSHAHNFIIDTLRYGGVIGALLLLAQVGYTGFCGLSIIKRDKNFLPIVAWFFAGTFFLLTNGQQPLVKPHHIWFFYWLPLVLIIGKYLTVEQAVVKVDYQFKG